MVVETTGTQAIPNRINLALALLHTATNLYQFFVLPLWLLPLDPAWAWSLLPLVFFTNPFWSLIHEAIHDLFHSARGRNAFFGRGLSIQFGSPFRILRASHLLHHKLNRTPIEGTEFYDRQKGSVWTAAFGYYFQILGGLYLVEFLSPLLFFLPRRAVRGIKERFIQPESVSGLLLQNWNREEAVREIRLDASLMLLWFGGSLYAYGAHWPLWLAIVASRGFLISFLDNIYHYRTPVSDIFFARNLRLPRPLGQVLLHFNLHGIHHQNPAIPWIHLPTVFNLEKRVFHGNFFLAALSQLSGPVALQDLPAKGAGSKSA